MPQRPTNLYNTVNPLYNDIRYNSKIRYDVNLVCTKISRMCIFFIDSPMLFFRKTYVLDICKNSFAEPIQTNTQNVRLIKNVKGIRYNIVYYADRTY